MRLCSLICIPWFVGLLVCMCVAPCLLLWSHFVCMCVCLYLSVAEQRLVSRGGRMHRSPNATACSCCRFEGGHVCTFVFYLFLIILFVGWSRFCLCFCNDVFLYSFSAYFSILFTFCVFCAIPIVSCVCVCVACACVCVVWLCCCCCCCLFVYSFFLSAREHTSMRSLRLRERRSQRNYKRNTGKLVQKKVLYILCCMLLLSASVWLSDCN